MPFSKDFSNYGVELSDGWPLKVLQIIPGGPAQLTGLRHGLEVVGIGGHWLTGDANPTATCTNVMDTNWQNQCSLEFTVLRNGSSDEVKLKVTNDCSLGLQLKGNQPVFVTKIDKGTIRNR